MLKDTIKKILPDPVLDAARNAVDGAMLTGARSGKTRSNGWAR